MCCWITSSDSEYPGVNFKLIDFLGFYEIILDSGTYPT